MPKAEDIIEAFQTSWDGSEELKLALKVVGNASVEKSPTASSFTSVVSHYEFRDGARFRLRFSFATDPTDNECFLGVEDDVGLHFGFLDDINAYLLDIDVTSAPVKIITQALVKAAKMHARAGALVEPRPEAERGTADGAGPAATLLFPSVPPGKKSTRSAGYRIEDHPLAAILAAQQPAARLRAMHGMNGQVAGGAGGGGAGGGVAVDQAGPASGSTSDRKRSVPINFGSSRYATTTLMQQLRLLQKQDTRKEGFTAVPYPDDLYTWDVKLYFDDTSTNLGQDLAKLDGVDHLQLEFKFPSSFPTEPPVVRFLSPVIVGGHVTGAGALCMELLSAAGWTPVNSIDAVCIQIRALLISGNARICQQRPMSTERYTLEGALKDLSSIIFSHNWTVDNARIAKMPRVDGGKNER